MNAPDREPGPGESAALQALAATLASVIKGNGVVIERLLLGLVTGGHVLIEDVPGVGKTTLAKALARALDLDMRRVQFTPDLLPADILGSQVLDADNRGFSFHRGPIFTNLLLADEINRASPRTQSALLEAMSEEQVTVDGVTYPLERPFLVVATQNPVDAQGTYPLPEAQLDRFMLRLRMGYPEHDEALAMLYSQQLEHPVAALRPVADGALVNRLQEEARRITVAEPVAHYVLTLIEATRNDERLELGASPRGALMLFRSAQAQALMQGRSYVLPDDVLAVAEPVLAHRLILTNAARYGGVTTSDVVAGICERVPVPA